MKNIMLALALCGSVSVVAEEAEVTTPVVVEEEFVVAPVAPTQEELAELEAVIKSVPGLAEELDAVLSNNEEVVAAPADDAVVAE
jgi:hypothetical protein